jgi:hypothetical protein
MSCAQFLGPVPQQIKAGLKMKARLIHSPESSNLDVLICKAFSRLKLPNPLWSIKIFLLRNLARVLMSSILLGQSELYYSYN